MVTEIRYFSLCLTYVLGINLSSLIDDIREISGYARDKKILKLGGFLEDAIPKCLIIYPQNSKKEDNTLVKLDERWQESEHFVEFYKIGVNLPLKGKSYDKI